MSPLNAQAAGHDIDAIRRAKLGTLWDALRLHDRIAHHRWAKQAGNDRCAVCGLSLARLVAEIER